MLNLQAAHTDWWKTYEHISDILSNAAIKALPKERADDYIIAGES